MKERYTSDCLHEIGRTEKSKASHPDAASCVLFGVSIGGDGVDESSNDAVGGIDGRASVRH